ARAPSESDDAVQAVGALKSSPGNIASAAAERRRFRKTVGIFFVRVVGVSGRWVPSEAHQEVGEAVRQPAQRARGQPLAGFLPDSKARWSEAFSLKLESQGSSAASSERGDGQLRESRSFRWRAARFWH